MYVVGVTGQYGNGKTLTAVIKAHQWAAAHGSKIFANFPLRGAYLFDHYEDWYRVADLHGSVVIFDESQANFDSREWSGSGQTTMTKVLNYVRKMNCIFIFILPDYANIDKRIRDATDILIECKKHPISGTITNLVYNFRAQEMGPKGQFVRKWILPKSGQEQIFKLKLYATHSMVHRFPMPAQLQADKFFRELDKRHQAAIKRIYGDQYIEIETLEKEDLIYVRGEGA